MILFFGYADDPAFTRAVQASYEFGVDALVVDQRDLSGVELLVADAVSSDGFFDLGGARTPLSDIGAVYARPLAAVESADARAYARGKVMAEQVVEWLDVAPARVVNRPTDMTSNASKPYQAQLIARCGFTVPATLVTNDPEQVREFVAEHEQVVFKSTSGIRSIVGLLDGRRLADLERVRVLPTQFQAWVDGTDVRVHVVGGEVFATEITSTATDYRYAARDGRQCELRAITLPDELAERCVRLARELRLPLAGVDLRRTPDGDVVCFEVNPMPGYSFYESHTGQPISTALARFLAGKAE